MSNWMSKSEIMSSIEFYLKSGRLAGRPRKVVELASEIVGSMSNPNGLNDFKAALEELISKKVVSYDKTEQTVVLNNTTSNRK
jgi:hypothetical protein